LSSGASLPYNASAMPRKYHPLSKGTASRRERRRHPAPAAPPDAGVGVPPGDAATQSPPSLEAAPGAEEHLPLPGRREAAASRPPLGNASPGSAGRSHVYLTPEAKYLGHEFRNIMVLTLGMSLVIVVLSFFLR